MLTYADHGELNKHGRPFSCDKCLKDPQTKKYRGTIAKLRRCHEDRWDFTEKDSSCFPIQIEQGGPTFGFCPAKVARDDPYAMMVYKMLIAILETGLWPDKGGLYDQDVNWIDLVAEFGPLRKTLEFNEKFKTVAQSLGGGKNPSNTPPRKGRRP